MSENRSKASDAFRDLRHSLAEAYPNFAVASNQGHNANVLLKTIRTFVREERVRQNLEQSSLAHILDVSQSAISKFETGVGDIGVKNLSRVSQALGFLPLVIFVNQKQVSSVRENPQALLDIMANTQTQLYRQIHDLII